jgi:predicted acetyltransferase
MIQYSEDRYKPELKALWKQCFPQDDDEYITFYFDEIYKNDESLIYLENEKPIAFLQMVPYRNGGYLSGVMTHPEKRNRGISSQIIRKSFDEMGKKGYDYTFLIPQEEGLVRFYEKFGYVPAYPKHQSILRNFFNWKAVLFVEEDELETAFHKSMIKFLNGKNEL